LLLVFSSISFPPAPEFSIKTVSNFYENSRRYSRVKVHHRYQRHRWQIFPPVSTAPMTNCHRYQRHWRQIMATISGCRHLKVNLKAKSYIYVNSTTQRCPNKIIKIFQFEGFFSFATGGKPWLRIPPRIFENI
jgi:hypothetical protein